ncbi:hypothetical protein ACGFYV_01505 [Streptomyces sp. NPDC048297]|uniref:hypothetical protein n=1 Tax=Streptomyces sp. NPDC048297 TaxID=3365531 RepID=UPI00371E1DB1
MSSGQKAVSAFLSLISTLMVLIVGLWLRWSPWMWLGALVLLFAVWAVATQAAIRARRRDPFPEGSLIEQPAPPPVERQEVYVTRVPLPSGFPDYDFLFSARVRWCPTDPVTGPQLINPGALAVESVLSRASRVAADVEPFRSSFLRHRLDAALGVMEPDGEGHVRAMALDVELSLADEDRERLDRLAAIRKDEAVWEHQRRYEQNKREYLSNDVLTSTGQAVVWWLARNDEHVEKTVKDIGLLARLSSAANDREVDEPFRHLVPEAYPPSPGGQAPPAPQESLFARESPFTHESPTAQRTAGPADLLADFFRTVDFPPGEKESALIADQIALAVAPWNEAAADEIRRRFGVPSAPPHRNDAGPVPPGDGQEGGDQEEDDPDGPGEPGGAPHHP